VNSVADRLDESPDSYHNCELQLRHFGGRRSFDGAIRTVQCYDDTVLVKQVLAEPGNGQVLVIDGAGSPRVALMGDRTALMAAQNGWAGLVIFGMVRDVDALSQLDIGIKALGSTPRKPAQDGVGSIDVPVRFGSARFTPGAHLWSDSDGVIVEITPGAAATSAGSTGSGEPNG
jgi:regulator of ribonuclease activity A